jgi:hypothetical protein
MRTGPLTAGSTEFSKPGGRGITLFYRSYLIAIISASHCPALTTSPTVLPRCALASGEACDTVPFAGWLHPRRRCQSSVRVRHRERSSRYFRTGPRPCRDRWKRFAHWRAAHSSNVIFVYKCSAHRRNMVIPTGISTPARRGTVQREPRSRKGFCERRDDWPNFPCLPTAALAPKVCATNPTSSTR